MKGKFGILMVIAALCLPDGLSAETSPLSDIASRLDSTGGFSADITYSVSLPMAEDDIVYTLRVSSAPEPGDPLLGENYIIDWQLPAGEEVSSGFLAYFDGHSYRYRDNRLMEHHYQWDSIPFLTPDGGIQRNGQFLDLLPRSLARQLRSMARDTTFSVTVTPGGVADGRNACTVSAVQTIRGLESRRFSLQTDAATGRPLRLSVLYNPGMLGEQEVNAVYTYADTAALPPPASEEEMIARYPDVFENYRVNNYSVENLRGKPIPSFALPTTTRERYCHTKGEPFPSPVILALLDPAVSSTGEVIGVLRSVIDRLPSQTGLILAFNSNNADDIEEQTGRARMGETHLTSGRTLARDCGVSAYPVFILCDSSGNVADVILGYSSTLEEDILQRGALLK